MIPNLKAKLIKSLKTKKNRYKKMLFVVEGAKTITQFIKKGFEIHSLFVLENINLEKDFEDVNDSKLVYINYKNLKKISSFESPRDALAIFKMVPESDFRIKKGEWVILLDDIRNPSNLGSIIRICDWFGIKKIVCSNDSVDKYNDKTIKSSMGSLANIEIFYVDVIEFINKHRDKSIYGFFPKGRSISDVIFDEEGGILLFGNESNGIRKDLLPIIKNRITIPKYYDNSNIDSLNISISVGVSLYSLRLNN